MVTSGWARRAETRQIVVKSEGLNITPPDKWKGILIPAEGEFSQADGGQRPGSTDPGVGTVLLPGLGTMIGFMAKKKEVKDETPGARDRR